jgi:hypothetical protein
VERVSKTAPRATFSQVQRLMRLSRCGRFWFWFLKAAHPQGTAAAMNKSLSKLSGPRHQRQFAIDWAVMIRVNSSHYSECCSRVGPGQFYLKVQSV